MDGVAVGAVSAGRAVRLSRHLQIPSETQAVASEKLRQSRTIHHHRLRGSRRRYAFASAIEERDANLVVIVFGAVGYAVGNGRVIVDRPRPDTSVVMGPARYRAGSSNPRTSGAVERQKPERGDRLNFGE